MKSSIIGLKDPEDPLEDKALPKPDVEPEVGPVDEPLVGPLDEPEVGPEMEPEVEPEVEANDGL